MNSRFLPSLIAIALSSVLIQSACASSETAEKRLKTAVDEVVAIAEHSSDRAALAAGVKPVLQNNLSFETMTRRAIGPGWRQFTPQQQKEAVELFAALIIRTYTAKFTPGELPQITYKAASSPSPGRVEVPTTLVYKGSHYEVVYRQEEADDWRITDVVIEGVSMIANYRTQFDGEFQQGGADAVLKSLKKSIASPQST